MIREAVQSQIEKYEWDGGADILIYIPEGVEIAKKTFNPRLGDRRRDFGTRNIRDRRTDE